MTKFEFPKDLDDKGLEAVLVSSKRNGSIYQ